MTIFIIGLGLIGGSIGLELSRQLGVKTIGFDYLPAHQKEALDKGIVHEAGLWQSDLHKSDIILIATPVSIIETLLPDVLDRVTEQQVVIDLGSTKQHIVEAVRKHPMRGRYVAAHPLAGTEHSGPQAAHLGLFAGKRNIICDSGDSDEAAVQQALDLFDSLGMTTLLMDSQDHDKHLAYVSHLSHVTSFALGLTVLDLEEDTGRIMQLAGTGFASTARLAKSNPAMWESIFTNNAQPITTALDAYIDRLQDLRQAIISQDKPQLIQLLKEANKLTPYI
jgi:prephenate dehydrogenase